MNFSVKGGLIASWGKHATRARWH